MPVSGRFVLQYSTVLLIVGFITLLGIVGMTIWLSERAQIYAMDATAARDIRVSAVDLRSALQSAESSQRGFLVSGNQIYLAPYDNAKASLEKHLMRLRALLAASIEEQPKLLRLSAIIGEKRTEMDRTIAARMAGKNSDALALFQTNRGKALMDEANVFLSSIIRGADGRLSAGMAEQQENALRLRWISLVGGALIIGVVTGVALLGFRYASETAAARDRVRDLNVDLEKRVLERTAALAEARDRAELLVGEVNHRVANSLMMVASLVKLQSNTVANDEAKIALAETESRIQAIANVHKRLYSTGDVRSVAVDEYLTDLLSHIRRSMHDEGHGASLSYVLDSVRLPTDSSINLGVVVTEWVTNAFKYAYPDRRGEVRVKLKRLADGRGELAVEDDGIGRDDRAPVKGTGLGTRLVKAMAASLRGEITYLPLTPGTLACLRFPVPNTEA